MLALAKLNIDNNQDIAQELRIQNIPHIFAFYKGKIVANFQGVPAGFFYFFFIISFQKTTNYKTFSTLFSNSEAELHRRQSLRKPMNFLNKTTSKKQLNSTLNYFKISH
jgi:hypothetical protein